MYRSYPNYFFVNNCGEEKTNKTSATSRRKLPLSRGRENVTIKLPHLPSTKEQTIVPLLERFYWIHSYSDGTDWNAIEVVVPGDKKMIAPGLIVLLLEMLKV